VGYLVSPNSKLVAIVTARYSSRRLPGKVIRVLGGKPMLAHTFARLNAVAELDEIVLATSHDKSDDPVAAFGADAGLTVYRGELDDLLRRMTGAARTHNADAIVRISGDSPLIDPAVVRQAIGLHRVATAEIVTNVFPRSFPKGQSVEVLTAPALARLDLEATESADREHVTFYAYTHPHRFKIHNFTSPNPRPDLQLSVDTQADFDRVEALLAATNADRGFADVARLIALNDKLALTP
jgi:spore coat polysaccharide biosynthesis protein SpsF